MLEKVREGVREEVVDNTEGEHTEISDGDSKQGEQMYLAEPLDLVQSGLTYDCNYQEYSSSHGGSS